MTKSWVLTSRQSTGKTGTLNAQQELKWAAEIVDARMGYTLLDLRKNEFVWGLWNDRPVQEDYVTRLMKDFVANGIMYSLVDVAIPCIIKRSDIDPACLVNDKGISADIPYIKFTTNPPPAIKAAGGRHRAKAWNKLRDNVDETAQQVDETIQTLESLEEQTAEDLDSLALARTEKEDNEVVRESMKGWLAAIYDEGMWCVCPDRSDCTLIPYQISDKLTEGAKVVLSRNTHRTELVEQDTEKLVGFMRDLLLPDGSIDNEKWDSATAKAKSNNKIARIFAHRDYVMMLLLLRQWGSHFRYTDAFNTTFLFTQVIGTHGGVSDIVRQVTDLLTLKHMVLRLLHVSSDSCMPTS